LYTNKILINIRAKVYLQLISKPKFGYSKFFVVNSEKKE